MGDVNWSECPAHATHLGETTRRERTVHCDLPTHCALDDGTARHWDSDLDIYWVYADGAGYDSTEADPVMEELNRR